MDLGKGRVTLLFLFGPTPKVGILEDYKIETAYTRRPLIIFLFFILRTTARPRGVYGQI